MRRRRRAPESSLELLLDTICNTFGGVLFLAILVTVLLRVSSKVESSVAADSQASPAEVLAMDAEQTALQTRLAELRQASRQQAQLAQDFFRSDNDALLRELRELQTDRDAASAERSQILSQIAQGQARTVQVQDELAELDVELKKAGDELEAAQIALSSETAARTQAARLPRLRTSFKPEIGLIVRYGRVYMWHRYGRFNEKLGLNTDDFVIVDDEGGKLVTVPKPYAGIDIGAPDFQQDLASRLRQFSGKNNNLCIVVWPDSFDTFQMLKTVVVNLSFEYRLIPMDEGGELMDRGGIGGQVQ